MTFLVDKVNRISSIAKQISWMTLTLGAIMARMHGVDVENQHTFSLSGHSSTAYTIHTSQ
jgi:hypothetical protein